MKDDIEIKNMIPYENMRVVKTIREREYDDDETLLKLDAHIIFKQIEPNESFFKKFMLLKNYKDGRIEYVTSRKMLVQYGEWKHYAEDEWEELVSFKHYQGSKKDLYSWSAYVVPKDAKIDERFIFRILLVIL